MKNKPENKKSRAKVEQLHASKDLSASELKKLRGGTKGKNNQEYFVIKLQDLQIDQVTRREVLEGQSTKET